LSETQGSKPVRGGRIVQKRRGPLGKVDGLSIPGVGGEKKVPLGKSVDKKRYHNNNGKEFCLKREL